MLAKPPAVNWENTPLLPIHYNDVKFSHNIHSLPVPKQIFIGTNFTSLVLPEIGIFKKQLSLQPVMPILLPSLPWHFRFSVWASCQIRKIAGCA